jgi:hypothetical protein
VIGVKSLIGAWIECGIDCERSGIAEHQHVAVWRGLGDHVGGHDPAGSRHILHDKRPAESSAELVCEEPRENVRITAGA